MAQHNNKWIINGCLLCFSAEKNSKFKINGGFASLKNNIYGPVAVCSVFSLSCSIPSAPEAIYGQGLSTWCFIAWGRHGNSLPVWLVVSNVFVVGRLASSFISKASTMSNYRCQFCFSKSSLSVNEVLISILKAASFHWIPVRYVNGCFHPSPEPLKNSNLKFYNPEYSDAASFLRQCAGQ